MENKRYFRNTIEMEDHDNASICFEIGTLWELSDGKGFPVLTVVNDDFTYSINYEKHRESFKEVDPPDI